MSSSASSEATTRHKVHFAVSPGVLQYNRQKKKKKQKKLYKEEVFPMTFFNRQRKRKRKNNKNQDNYTSNINHVKKYSKPN